MSIMQVEVVSSEQNIYSGEASFVVVPTVQGELGIYPRHEPIMSLVRPGALRLTVPGQAEEVLVAVSGGLLEVQPEKITVLADVAVRSAEMDQERAEQAKKAAEDRISKAQDDESLAKAHAALAAAIAQLRTLDYLRSQKNK
ncbi:F0F1 ATP synthase subunit epsilon [Neisseria sp. N95_16]|uniref:ATP synthase epsilon chain n=1 Tax=Neisseria brasiliensis TaxID=2666100 RepID=A0A5Q3RYJ0_9NEIS|nr:MULTISPECIES: F0F1 ATP synthase subunit epsilon [Neisseria]MRN37887.1 F0F1 ATP synthase subunit epsilon [Neisseria brasiliensis]PJO09037.1 F0F1 ATP synthase subunit epsilon [Neisseria sp. N95_16]PJO77260.1 F0F1 ATP synthase subunit epsilon [Neisseria sp. N177_16]QGL24835.1 F0F1 ATP synthase subunit epsilon [Neisseria brasiliensis]